MPARKTKKKSSYQSGRHPLMREYGARSQAEFFRKHPMAQTLLMLFMLSVAIFFVVVYMNMGMYAR